MTAALYDTVIDQGADWFMNFIYRDPDSQPIDLTGATAAMQFRSLPQDAISVLTLTTENGGITITGAEGKLAVHATATQTGSIDTGYYYYDIEIYMEGVTMRLIQGQVLVSAQVTR